MYKKPLRRKRRKLFFLLQKIFLYNAARSYRITNYRIVVLVFHIRRHELARHWWKSSNSVNNVSDICLFNNYLLTKDTSLKFQTYRKNVYGFMDEMDEKELKHPNSEGFTYSNLLKRDRRRWTYAGKYWPLRRQDSGHSRPDPKSGSKLQLAKCLSLRACLGVSRVS